jgi:hypothetical protein
MQRLNLFRRISISIEMDMKRAKETTTELVKAVIQYLIGYPLDTQWITLDGHWLTDFQESFITYTDKAMRSEHLPLERLCLSSIGLYRDRIDALKRAERKEAVTACENSLESPSL